MKNRKHALLSASSASRWTICTASPLFEEQFPESTSSYAEEGTLAHRFADLKVLKYFTTKLTKSKYAAELKKLKSNIFYSAEMDNTTDAYLEHLKTKAMEYKNPPLVNSEVRVDFSEYVPDGFGTCDCIMIGGDMLDITDYKHGKGVPVSAKENPQMRLYALGALEKFKPFYGDVIKRVRMTIFQPRVQDEPSSETITVDELIRWGESIKPIAQKAFSGFGEFIPGEHCRFCRGKALCRARAEVHTAFEDFKDIALPNAQTDERKLTNAEIGTLLISGKTLVAWYNDLEEYALSALLNGEEIPGWKAVEGRSVRTFTDHEAAAQAVIASGYDEALVYERKPLALTAIEKLMGKEAFTEKIGTYVYKPPGKPTIAPQSDKREPYNPAAIDFKGIKTN